MCVEGSGADSGVVDSGTVDSATTDSSLTDSAIPDSAPSDSGIIDGGMDGGTSAPPPTSTTCWRSPVVCDWTVPGFSFEEVTGTGEFTNYAAAGADFSPDGCSVYYAIYLSGHFSIYRTDRSGPGAAFGTPVEVAGVNQADVDQDGPSIGPDGLEFFFTSDRGPSGTRRVHRSARAGTGDVWGEPVRIPALDIAGSVGWEPRVAPHGLRLYYAHKAIEQGVHVTERANLGDEFGPPIRVRFEGLPTNTYTNRPSVTQSDRLLVAIRQPAGSDRGERRPFYATRPNWTAPWSSVLPVPTTVGADGMRDMGVSADGCELLVRDNVDHAALMRYVAP